MILSEKRIRQIIKEEIGNISSSNINLKISPSLERCISHKDLIGDFCHYVSKFLSILSTPISIEIVDNREKNGVKTTAFYDPNTHRIVIYGKDRAVVDICRSIAHEMTHMQQMVEDRLSFPVQDAGGEIEDEANAKAGEIIKLFAKSSPERLKIYESKNLK